jgi:RNA methyltransferase, TrmH family
MKRYSLIMLTSSQEKLLRLLHTKKGRDAKQQCLVEGARVIATAGNAVAWTFQKKDSRNFTKLVTTTTPQDIAGVANIPQWTIDDVMKKKTIVVLDHVQDPGNVGAIMRLCLGFSASLLLIESADVTSPKVVRSSAGALFSVPWMTMKRAEAPAHIASFNRSIVRLERRRGARTVNTLATKKPTIIVVGSEGDGITLPIDAPSVVIPHDSALESLNVTHAITVALYVRFSFANPTK